MREPITYRLETLDFDGPLDLLLSLIEKNKYSIFDIPITEITRQYLEYVEKLKEKDMDIISEFLLMAATLLEIKTKMLLPREKDEQGEEIDPRKELVERLIQYKKYRMLADELADAGDEAARFVYKEETLPAEVKEYVPPIDLDKFLNGVTAESLGRILEEVLKRKEYRADTERADFGVIRKERMPLGRRIRSLVKYARKKRTFSFKEMLEANYTREDVVVSFLAVLELMKMGRIEAAQKDDGDIALTVKETIDTDDLDLEGIVDE